MEKLKEYAIRRLAATSEHSVTLSAALKRKGGTQEEIAPIIEEFTHLGYLNDTDWVEGFVRGQRRKHYGNEAIRQKLFKKGIGREEIENALATVDYDPKKAITHLLSTRLKAKERPKQIAALIRRGFSYDDILTTL